MDTGDKPVVPNHGNKHSWLEEVMEMVSGIRVEQLILGHLSSRYSPEQVDRRIKELCHKYAISIPVYRLQPLYFSTHQLFELSMPGPYRCIG